MAVSWLTALENLQGQFKGYAEVEKLIEKDYEWAHDVVNEATALFKKDCSNNDEDNEDDEADTSENAPVLLPQTPRVRHDRAERLKNCSTIRRSSIRVVSGALASNRRLTRQSMARKSNRLGVAASKAVVIREPEKQIEIDESSSMTVDESEGASEKIAALTETVTDESKGEEESTDVVDSSQDAANNKRPQSPAHGKVAKDDHDTSKRPLRQSTRHATKSDVVEELVAKCPPKATAEKPPRESSVRASKKKAVETRESTESETGKRPIRQSTRHAAKNDVVEEAVALQVDKKEEEMAENEGKRPTRQSNRNAKKDADLVKSPVGSSKEAVESVKKPPRQSSKRTTKKELQEEAMEVDDGKEPTETEQMKRPTRQSTRHATKNDVAEEAKLDHDNASKSIRQSSRHASKKDIIEEKNTREETSTANTPEIEASVVTSGSDLKVDSISTEVGKKVESIAEEVKKPARQSTRNATKKDIQEDENSSEIGDVRKPTRQSTRHATKKDVQEEISEAAPVTATNIAAASPVAAPRSARKPGKKTKAETPQKPAKFHRHLNTTNEDEDNTTSSDGAKKRKLNTSISSSKGSPYRFPASATKFTPKTGTRTTPSNLLNIRSFLPTKPVVHKPTPEEIQQKREEELRMKKEKELEAIKRKEELKMMKVEEKRLLREAKAQKALEARKAQEKQRLLAQQNQEKETRGKLESLNKLREARAAEAERKKAELDKKLQEAEERRAREELEKKKKEEEAKKAMEDKRRRDEEEAKMREEKRAKELEAEKRRKALIEASEKRMREEEARIKQKLAEAEKIKKAALEAEEKRRRDEEARLREERFAKLREMVSKAPLNKTFDKDTSQLNSTYTKDASQMNSTYSKAHDESQTNSYDITPARHELPPEPLKDENNYDIKDLRSDDDTDDDENPRKIIPSWATGAPLRTALMHQAYNPPDIDMIFMVIEPTVDLTEVFEQKKRRFFKRTSSAVWGKAPITHKF